MDDIVARPAEEISREQLYELVRQTRMSKLGAQLATNKGPDSYAALVKVSCGRSDAESEKS